MLDSHGYDLYDYKKKEHEVNLKVSCRHYKYSCFPLLSLDFIFKMDLKYILRWKCSPSLNMWSMASLARSKHPKVHSQHLFTLATSFS